MKKNKKHYAVGFTFGQCHQKEDRCLSFVVSTVSEKDAIQKAVDLTVEQSPSINGPQIETMVFPDEDTMSEFWYSSSSGCKSIKYSGITSHNLL